MAFKGSFLIRSLEEYEGLIIDADMLFRAAVEKIGESIHNILSDLGYSSSYPHPIKDINSFNLQEIEDSDIYIEIRYLSKNVFIASENDIKNRYSESSLERILGLEMIKEGVPFLIQEEIYERDGSLVAKPDFLILSEKPIAVYCDSKKYHLRKRRQYIKDRRIDRKLQLMGFTVLRFYEDEIINNPRECVEEIKQHVFGRKYALTKEEIYLEIINAIQNERLSSWETQYLRKVKEKIISGKPISLEDEKILRDIVKKIVGD